MIKTEESHKPGSKASIWRRKGLAYLDSDFVEPVAYAIEAIGTGNKRSTRSGIELSRVTERSPYSRPPRRHIESPQQFSVDWRIGRVWGAFEGFDFERIGAVNVWGTPSPEVLPDRQIRSYADIIYYLGQIQLESPERPGLKLALGSVVSLGLVTETRTYTVWE